MAAGQSGPAVELTAISKSFGAIKAADDITFAVKQGEFCTLLGPSGCGKSTLLRIIAGFELPDHGSVMINGVDCTRTPPHRRDTAMVFQGYALFPHRSVLENVCFGLRMRGRGTRREIERKAMEALELVSLVNVEHRYPAQLSGGQQQRVALARAMVLAPSVLLLDEPLSALDLKLRRAMRFELKRLQSQAGLTTIFVTHDQEEAMSLSDRMALMNGGRIEQIGSPDELYNHPASRFVGDFLGESTIFAGSIAALAGDGNAVVLLDGIGDTVRCAVPSSANGRAGFTVGDKVAVIVRAADIEVQPPDAPGLPGEVVQHAFAGPMRRLHIKPCNSDLIVTADVPASKYAFGSASVRLSWRPDAAIVVRPT